MTPPRDPDSGKGRVPHRDYPREVTRPGPHVIGDLGATDDDFGAHTPVEELTAAAQEVGDAARSLAAHAISRDEAAGIRMRLATLETWRVGDVDPWRLRLTGVADTNGRMGRLDARVDELREDVGTSEQRREERAAIASMRSDRKRVVAALVAAATIAGGGLYTIRDRYDASVEARGADTQWRKGIEKQLDTLFSLFGLKPPTSGATP